VTPPLELLERLATGRRAALLLLLTASAFLSVNLLEFPASVPHMARVSGQSYLDMQGFYTAEGAYRLLQAFGPEGRRLQLRMLLTIDVALPLLAAAAGAAAITFLGRRAHLPRAWLRRLLVLPLAALAADALENAAVAGLVLAYPRRLGALASAAGVLTAGKTVLYLATALAALILAALAGVWLARARAVRRYSTQ
jgi:hypothetical protein